MYCTDRQNLRISIYVKDKDNKEYRIAYINYKDPYSKIDVVYLGKLTKEENRAYSLIKNFMVSINDKLHANDLEIMNFLKRKGYINEKIEEIVIYAYASDHDRGDTSTYLESILGFDIDREFGFDNSNVSVLSRKCDVPYSDLESIYNLYSKFKLSEIFIRKVDNINSKCTYEIALNNDIENVFDSSILDYSIKKGNEVLPYEIPKDVAYVNLVDTFDGRQNYDMFVVLNKTPKDVFIKDIQLFLDEQFEEMLNNERKYEEDDELLLDPTEKYFNRLFRNYNNNDVILIYEDGNKKYPYSRLKKHINELEKIEIEYSRKKFVYDITKNLCDEGLTLKEVFFKLTEDNEKFSYELHTSENDYYKSRILISWIDVSDITKEEMESNFDEKEYIDRKVKFVSKISREDYFIVIEGERIKDLEEREKD